MTGDDIINALLKPLGTNLNNYERRWHEEVVRVANAMADERAELMELIGRAGFHLIYAHKRGGKWRSHDDDLCTCGSHVFYSDMDSIEREMRRADAKEAA